MLTRRCHFSVNFFEDDYLQSVEKTYNFAIESLLYYQRLFEYSGDIVQLLSLPYNMFQDLILKQIELKKKEKKEREKAIEEKRKKVPRRGV